MNQKGQKLKKTKGRRYWHGDRKIFCVCDVGVCLYHKQIFPFFPTNPNKR